MAYVISEKCIQCGSCAPFCKNGAIDWIDHQYRIDPDKCEMCGTCREYCPIDNVIEESSVLVQKSQPAAIHNN